MIFRCERCHYAGRYSTWVTARWRDGNQMQRCERCGSPHSCRYGREASAVNPPLGDIHGPGVLSPWVSSQYRPYRAGTYECEFTTGLQLILVWNGTAWTYNNLVVDMATHRKWRGRWIG